MLGRIAQHLRAASHFGGQHHTPVEVGANDLREIPSAARTEMRATTEEIGGELAQEKALRTGLTSSNRVIQTIVEENAALVGGQGLWHMATDMGQAAAVGEDTVARHDRSGTFRTLDLALGRHHASPTFGPQGYRVSAGRDRRLIGRGHLTDRKSTRLNSS